MADFEWSWPTKIEREVIERALTLDFLPEARNLVLVGANGLGKTMIAQNICHAAVLAGYSVLFRSAAALLEELQRQTPEGRRSKLRTYANVGLLCIDEVGYLSFDDKAADLLYEVVNRRYERKPVILTTNRPFKEWNEVFPNATCIITLLDRLLHHADVTVIEGDSYRDATIIGFDCPLLLNPFWAPYALRKSPRPSIQPGDLTVPSANTTMLPSMPVLISVGPQGQEKAGSGPSENCLAVRCCRLECGYPVGPSSARADKANFGAIVCAMTCRRNPSCWHTHTLLEAFSPMVRQDCSRPVAGPLRGIYSI